MDTDSKVAAETTQNGPCSPQEMEVEVIESTYTVSKDQQV